METLIQLTVTKAQAHDLIAGLNAERDILLRAFRGNDRPKLKAHLAQRVSELEALRESIASAGSASLRS